MSDLAYLSDLLLFFIDAKCLVPVKCLPVEKRLITLKVYQPQKV